MVYTGKIRTCDINSNAGSATITFKVTLDVFKSVIIEETDSLKNLAKKFDLIILQNSVAVDKFIGRKCKIDFKNNVYTFKSFVDIL